MTVRPASPSQSLESRFSVQISDFLSVLKRDPATVRRAHDGPSLGSSPQPVFFSEIKSAAQNNYIGRYIRYQFTHRSSPNDHKKENKGEKEYLNL